MAGPLRTPTSGFGWSINAVTNFKHANFNQTVTHTHNNSYILQVT